MDNQKLAFYEREIERIREHLCRLVGEDIHKLQHRDVQLMSTQLDELILAFHKLKRNWEKKAGC